MIDIKPYIEKYDYPLKRDYLTDSSNSEAVPEQIEESKNTVPTGWVDGSVVSEIEVEFTNRSLTQLSRFHSPCGENCEYCLGLFGTIQDAKNAIVNLLKQDPRSVYRRNKCQDKLYFFTIDTIHLTAWFDEHDGTVEVVRIMPWSVRKKMFENV